MGLDDFFNTEEFLHNLMANKPPYKCPYEVCGKVYKSFQGISQHMNSQHSACPGGDSAIGGSDRKKAKFSHHQDRNRSPASSDYGTSTAREALTYAEAQRVIEVEIEGRTHRININEPMNIVRFDGKNGLNSAVNEVPAENANVIRSGQECSKSSTKGKDNASNEALGTGSKHKSKSKLKGGKKSAQSGKSSAVLPSPAPAVPKLPEPSFRLLDSYDPPDASPRPNSYYRFIEKSADEMDDSIEYDMDEEDTAWLGLINKKRRQDNQTEVPPDTFELLMDRLEKESYFLSQNSGKEVGPAIDEDAVCCICNDGECQNSNAILFCDMCNLAVHQECYGVPYIPEGQWLCRRCLHSPSNAVDCVLCPNKGGAFKQTDESEWAHVVCALWIPEVCFANTVFLEPIDSIKSIPSARWKLNCYICKQKVGACIQCHKQNCYVAFHVTCAQQAGLFMKMECVREITPQGPRNGVRKAAYCHTHTPPDENGTSLSGVYGSGDEEDSRSSMNTSRKSILANANDAEFKEKMKKTRKILAEKRSALPVVSIPTIPPDRLTKIAAKITFPKRNQFIQRLLGYWTLKRQSRNGVPLLRRLQISYMGSRRDEARGDDDENTSKIREDLKRMQRVRQDLERARLLCEQIKKREKLKMEQIIKLQRAVELQLQPFKIFLLSVIAQLEAKDKDKFFIDPVNIDEVPDYLDFITNPMDFSTMRAKAEANEYTSLKKLEEDFELITKNCMSYNDPDTIYHKSAEKMRNAGRNVLREAAVKADRIGYNQRAGIHSPPIPLEEHRTVTITEVRDEEKKLRERLLLLNEDLDRVRQCKSGGSRSKKIKELSTQITNVQRQLSVLNPTMFCDLNFDEPATSGAAKKVTPKKSHSRHGAVSDSEATDVCDLSSPIKLSEGRRTMNSVSVVCFNDSIASLADSKFAGKICLAT